MVRAKKSSDEIEAFRAALKATRGKTARSSLYRWLRSNHDHFLQDWHEGADWPAFVQAFTALGLTDRTGKPPIPETARKIWLQVRKDIAKDKAREQAKRAPSLMQDEIAPGVRAAPDRETDNAPRPRMTIEIRPATPRLDAAVTRSLSQSTTAARPSLPPTKPAETGDDANAQIRRVLDEIDATKVPIPRKV
ncbi:MAG TPA: hypothetical protein VEK34_06935 [Methylocella sp.]|nr:hypothetical protein [Methylocella sp.]